MFGKKQKERKDSCGRMVEDEVQVRNIKVLEWVIEEDSAARHGR